MTYTDLGIILRKRDYGEDDRRYSIYTKNHGKIEAGAIGVRKIKSKLAGHLESLTLGEFMFANGRRVERVIQASMFDNFKNIKSNFQLLSQAFFVAELADALIKQGEKDIRIFELLQKIFSILNQGASSNLEEIFAVKLFQLLGFELSFDHCAVCRRSFESPLCLTVEPEKGGGLCFECNQGASAEAVLLSSLTVDIIKSIFSAEIGALQPLEVPQSAQQELKLFVDAYLKAHLETKLKSRRFLELAYIQ